MAIKIEDFGGASDWEDGTVLNAADLMDTIKYLTSNKCLGLTPTASGTFTASPTDLGNITDEDVTTGTGTMTQVTGPKTGYINIDLGSNGIHTRVYAKYDFNLSSTANGGCSIQVSENNSDWTTISGLSGGAFSSGTVNTWVNIIPMKFRYIRYNMTSNDVGSNTTSKLYEVSVI